MGCPEAEADQRTIEFIAEFLAGLGLNTKLREHGVRGEQIEALVAQAVEDPCHKTNAVPVTAGDFRNLYEEVL
jgi:alcohol dehydrogenase class IV